MVWRLELWSGKNQSGSRNLDDVLRTVCCSRSRLDWNLNAGQERVEYAQEFNIQGLPPLGLEKKLEDFPEDTGDLTVGESRREKIKREKTEGVLQGLPVFSQEALDDFPAAGQENEAVAAQQRKEIMKGMASASFSHDHRELGVRHVLFLQPHGVGITAIVYPFSSHTTSRMLNHRGRAIMQQSCSGSCAGFFISGLLRRCVVDVVWVLKGTTGGRMGGQEVKN